MNEKFNFKRLKTKQKYLLLAILVLAIAMALTVTMVIRNKGVVKVFTTKVVEGEANYAGEDAVSEEIKSYVSQYYDTQDTKRTISDSEMEQITAYITEHVLNNLSTSLSENEIDSIRDMIQNSVIEAIYENNTKVEKDYSSQLTEVTNQITEISNQTTTEIKELDSSLRDYIDKTVVPNVTALIQINTGNIKDLQDKLAKFSTTYASDKKTYDQNFTNIENKFKESNSSSATNLTEINEQITNTNTVMQEYITQNDAKNEALEKRVTTNEKEIESIKKKITAINEELQNQFNKDLADLKNSLTNQINNNKDLSDAEREALKNSINSLDSKTAKNIDDVKAKLTADLNAAGIQQSTALTDAVDNINSSIGELQKQVDENKKNIESLLQTRLEEVQKTLQEQIDANKSLSTDEKRQLSDAINSLDSKTAGDIDSVRDALNNYITANGNHSTSVDNAINDVNTSITNIWNAINSSKNDITNIQNSLDGCSIELRDDGHFYATKDGVSKKIGLCPVTLKDATGGVFANGMDTTEAKVEVTSRNYGPFAVEFDEGEPEVTKTGYTLTDGNHWVNADGAAMSPENVYENAEFFANWRQNAYTVSYNSNKPANASKEIAGTTADSSHLFDRDGETLSQNGYTLQGWTFNGWNTSPDGSGNKFDGSTGNYADMEQVKNLTTEDAKLLELFAQWNANTYHIAYNSNKPANASSLINGTMDDSILTYDTAANLSNLGYSLPGYTWTGWNDMADASGNAYSDGQEVLNLSDTQDAVVTMFAQWKPNTYTVLFDHTSSPVNGDITGDTSKTVTFDDVYGTLPTLNEKTGYTAQGWYTARTDGEKVTETTKVTNPSNHTLFARWTPNSYNISFDVNMGSQANKVAANASVNPGSMSVTYDAAYGTLPVPAWSGWTFKGWNLAPNGTGITRNGSDKVQITSDETVYAQWVDNTAPTFTMNATTGAIASNGTISFANVVEQGSGIAGYYIGQTQPDASGSNVTFGGTTSVTVNNSGTWYMAIKDNAGNMSAVQSVVYYSLTLNADGATNYTTNSAFIKAGTVITLPTGLTKTGYKADTWTGGISSITMNQNGSLSPSWTPNPYILTFNANGGYCSESSRIVYHGGQYGTLPNATRPGFSFAGWFTSPNSGVQIHDYNTVMAQSWTCYAHWIQTDFTAPTLSRNNVTAVTAAGGGTPYFSVTYNASDDSAGVNSYYWGTSAPTASSAWNSWSGGNISVNINLSRTQNYVQQGTYYFGVRDNCGNINYTPFKWLMTWYDASTGWGIQIPTGGLNYYNCGENHWGTIWIKDQSRSTKIAEFQANGGNSGTLDGNTSVWIGWEAFAFAAWN